MKTTKSTRQPPKRQRPPAVAPTAAAAVALPAPLEPRQAAFERLRFYESLPKYCWTPPPLINGQPPRRCNRTFASDGTLYRLSLVAASLFAADGQVQYHYPGAREELVDLVVRQLAQDETKVRESAGMLIFSLPLVQEELGRCGHEFTLPELCASLLILRVQLELKTVQKGMELAFNHYGTCAGIINK